MEFNQLRYFLQVVRRRNFTRAAQDCGVSQPALSQQIIKLEQELGQPVFERLGREVSLTDAGKLLKDRAERILFLVDDARNQITDDGETGRIALAAIPTIAPYLLPTVLRDFKSKFPEAHVEVHEEVTEDSLRKCQQGEVDLALIALPIDVQHLDVETLFDEELLVVLPPGHPLNDRKRISANDIRAEPFVLLDEAHCLSESVVSYCTQRAFQPIATGRSSQLATIQELVSLGHGISLIPRMAERVDQSDRRTYRRLSGEKPQRTIAMCWNPYRYQSKLTQNLMDCLRAYSPEA
ncbi:UNVERIFIED_CONTAM: hypothetical protein GTU68_053671 [Idotea baltica]|nr:hypothetical protein [Idotea baltica]